jgi:hypothetical protein
MPPTTKRTAAEKKALGYLRELCDAVLLHLKAIDACIYACRCHYEQDIQTCDYNNDPGPCYEEAAERLNYCTGDICHATWFSTSQCSS